MSTAIRFQMTSDADPSLLPPKRASAGAAGYDLCANLSNDVELHPMEVKLIPTGLILELPEQVEAQIRPRSGLAIKSGITLPNSPATIDWDYRGEIKVGLINLSNDVFRVTHGMRIAQIVFAHVLTPDLYEAPELSKTIRGTAGFGSTGRG